jgi:hypothetical protein
MNKKALGIIIVLSISIVSLVAYIMILQLIKHECELLHFDDNLQLWGMADAVPDAETAIKVADIIIDAQIKRFSEEGRNFSTGLDYEIEVIFYDSENIWDIYYNPGATLGGAINISIRKDCGMITGMAFIP